MKLKLKNTSGESVTLIIKPEDTFIDLQERVAEELGLRLDLSDIVNGEHYLETQRVLDFFSQLPNGDEASYVSEDTVHYDCIVPGCKKDKITHPHLSFFEFPQEELRNHQWALYCQRLLGPSGKKKLNITHTSRICSDHFRPEHFVKNAGTILKRTAVPCINPEVAPSHSITHSETPDSHINYVSNHSIFDKITSESDVNNIALKKENRPVCRLCAKYTDNSIYLFDETNQPLTLAQKINSCLPINIDMSGSLPKQICTDCFINVEKLFKFTESCIETHMELKHKAIEQQLGESIIARSDEAEDKPGLTLSCDFTQELITPPSCSGTDCTLCGDGKLCLTSLAFPDRAPLLTDPLISVKTINSINETVVPQTKIKEENLNDSWEAADNAFNYYCNRCSADFKSFSDLLPHSLMHSEDGNYVCVLCDFVGERKTDLTIHFKTHDVEPTVYQCDNCGIGFRSLSLFEIHNCIANNCSLNRCNICHKTFRSESRLEFHKKFHETHGKLGQCEYCPKRFSDEMKLYKHVTYLHSDKKSSKNISCEECGKSFRSLSSLRYHMRVHLGEPFSARPFSCDICCKSFSRRSMLRNHITVFHKTLSQETDCFMCSVCSEIFPFSDSACFHLEKTHPLNSEGTYQSINSKVLVCEFCKRCFPSSSHINNHRCKHKNETPYECKHCCCEFETSADLDSHVQSEHTESVSKEYLCEFNSPLLYSCEYCDRHFISLVKYSEHQTIHYGPTPYQCRLCDSKFPTLEDSYSHKLSKHPEESESSKTNYYRPFDCHYCNKSFAIEDALIKHIRMHTGEKPFICDVCGKAFSQSSGLYTHQKVHSTDRPYSCTICPRKFKIKGDRDIHVRKHSGERPYKCEFCGKAFMTQHVYSQHRKIHTGERPYKCDVCHISFRRSHVLTVHKRIHTGEKPNMCDICGKSYRQKGDMLKHKRIQHGYVHQSKQNQMFHPHQM